MPLLSGSSQKTIGKNIFHCRKDKKISQAELSERLKISRQQLFSYEKAKNRISASRLFEAAKILNKPISFFFE